MQLSKTQCYCKITLRLIKSTIQRNAICTIHLEPKPTLASKNNFEVSTFGIFTCKTLETKTPNACLTRWNWTQANNIRKWWNSTQANNISQRSRENWRKGKRSDHRIQRENGGGEEAAGGEVMEGNGSARSRWIWIGRLRRRALHGGWRTLRPNFTDEERSRIEESKGFVCQSV